MGPRLRQMLQSETEMAALRADDVERYFNTPLADISDETAADVGWLLKWWNRHQDEFPQVAAAARDYLSVAIAEVDVERVFNRGRDQCGLRRHSLSGEMMRELMLLQAAYLCEAGR